MMPSEGLTLRMLSKLKAKVATRAQVDIHDN